MKRSLSHASYEHIFFFVICAVVFYLFWNIIQPYVIVLLTAGVAAILLSPLDRKLTKFVGHQHIVSIIITLGVLLLLFLPAVFGLLVIAKQASEFLTQLQSDGVPFHLNPQSLPFYSWLPSFAQQQLTSFDVNQIGQSIATWAFNHVGTFFESMSRFLLNTFIFFFALYYILVDRKRLFTFLVKLSPLKKTTDQILVGRIVQTVRSVVFGILLLAIVQGVVAAIGMALFHVPGALLWGALTILAALIPLIGTGLVMVPAIIYLFLYGSMANAIGLLCWFLFLVGVIDNLLAPFLIKGTTHMHAFLILISVFGAIELFGPVGIIIGPTVLAALMTLLEIYQPGLLLDTSHTSTK